MSNYAELEKLAIADACQMYNDDCENYFANLVGLRVVFADGYKDSYIGDSVDDCLEQASYVGLSIVSYAEAPWQDIQDERQREQEPDPAELFDDGDGEALREQDDWAREDERAYWEKEGGLL